MMEPQLVTGATHDMRIFTGSALCAAVAHHSAKAAADVTFSMRMAFLLLFPASGDFAAVGERLASARYGEASSSTRPFVSTANRPVITAAIPATAQM
jgi:hypothetical protein